MAFRKRAGAFLTAAALMALILDGETALSGAAAGIALCLKTVIPSLFPFLFLCAVLTNALWGMQMRGAGRLCRKMGIPSGGETILIAAWLGGYPAGAQAVGSAFQNGALEKKDAEHLLTFCSNAGPAFLFGMMSALFPDKVTVWALWCIQLLSAALTAVSYRYIPRDTASFPGKEATLSDLLTQTVGVMGTICGWILLFRILAAFLERWLFCFLSVQMQVVITGLLELSNGCCGLLAINSIPLRFVICSGFLSFGGICVFMQTMSVIGTLSPVPYITGKLRQTFFGILLSVLYLYFGWYVLAASGVLILIYPGKTKNRGRIPVLQGV